MRNWKHYAKGVAAAVGAVLATVNAATLPPSWQPWATIVIGALTTAGVVRTPNAAKVNPGASS